MSAPFPVSFIVLSLLGLLCLIPGGLSLLGLGGMLHPLLADSMAGLALIVSGVALLGSAGFPLVLARLQAADRQSLPKEGADDALTQ